MTELDPRVAARLEAGDLLGAARLLHEAGEALRAARLFEQACAFGSAAIAACDAGDRGEGMRLAVLSGDRALSQRIAAELVTSEPPERVRRVAEGLSSRGEHGQAARLLEAIGDLEAAADAYGKAGRPAAAARAFDAAGLPAPAARVLEAALRGASHDDVDGLRAQLGELYARHGKHRAAVRVLQQIAESSERRGEILGVLGASLEALGLTQARRDLDAELRRRGLTARPSQPDGARGVEAVLYGRYRVIREVTTTPHARLLEAVDQLSGERVAVKVLASRAQGTGRDALSRFVREARALQRLRHPNVVPLRAFVGEGPAMVLAWMGGGSLSELLEREVISPARAAEIARAVLDALAEAHRLGILHRDIKPSNLLFDDGGAARLSDFGAAHLAESEATVTVGAIGSVAYMSPEQRAGRAATVQSDLFSVGVLLFEMLSGEVPSSARPVSVQACHPDLDATHDAVLERLLATAPEDRFADALEARRAVERASWPTRLAKRTVASVAPPGAVTPGAVDASQRAVPPRRNGDRHDVWLGRDVYVLPLDGHLRRAAAFARADHPALCTIFRADRTSGELWVEVPPGRPLAQGLTLDAAQHAELRHALEALHRAGAAHGAVDAEHVFVHCGRPRLAFPRAGTDADVADEAADLEALAALERAG